MLPWSNGGQVVVSHEESSSTIRVGSDSISWMSISAASWSRRHLLQVGFQQSQAEEIIFQQFGISKLVGKWLPNSPIECCQLSNERSREDVILHNSAIESGSPREFRRSKIIGPERGSLTKISTNVSCCRTRSTNPSKRSSPPISHCVSTHLVSSLKFATTRDLGAPPWVSRGTNCLSVDSSSLSDLVLRIFWTTSFRATRSCAPGIRAKLERSSTCRRSRTRRSERRFRADSVSSF